jgi:outer membrane lipoprotein SlyB
MTKLTKTLVAATVMVVALAGCKRPDPATLRAVINATDFSQATEPLLVTEFTSTRAIGVLAKAGVNGSVESWQSLDGAGLALDRGVLVRTLGTGRGILIADATGTKAALTGQGPREYQRLYKQLTGDNQIAESLFSCRMSGPVSEQITRTGRAATANHWQEACSSGSVSMVNDYWTQAGTDVVKSRQWIDSVAGHVLIEVPAGVPR